MSDHDYNNYPALKNYISRLEAELSVQAIQSGLKKISLRSGTREGYYTEHATLTISQDATIKCWPKEHAPTESEAEGINRELKDIVASWPKSIQAPIHNAETQRSRLGVADEDWFPCLTLDRQQVLWVQQRAEAQSTGKKYYVPWAFFDDAQWRQMEPDEGLAFWKPKERRAVLRLMIHEGPKAARAADRIATDPDGTHPWREELAFYEHWGLMSGAAAPERMDWEEVRKAGFDEVVYVCDNDEPGGEALIKVSEAYRGKLYGIKFNASFPQGWDMADPMPIGLFRGGHYIGSRLEDLMVPATWGVDQIKQERGRPLSVLRKDFLREWIHVVTPEVFINQRWPNRTYPTREFNNRVMPFTRLENTASKVMAHENSKADALTYRPDRPPGVIEVDGRRAT